MKISITGVTGDIGKSYLHNTHNRNSDNKIKALIRNGSSEIEKDITPVYFSDGFRYIVNSVEDFVNCDLLIHFAAFLNSERYNLVEYMATNAMLTGMLAYHAKQHKVSKVIYASTQMIYNLPVARELDKLCLNYVEFCEKFFSKKTNEHDLLFLAQKFINQNASFPFDKYNIYGLTKFLGEAIVKNLPNSTIVRISNAYGPGYENPRLIPRMVKSRLMGHDLRYLDEQRDFVYSDDVNMLIDTIADKDLTGVIDCRSDEIVETSDLAEMIVRATPTAYGRLIKYSCPEKTHQGSISTDMALSSIIRPAPFMRGLSETIYWHKSQTYNEMTDGRSLRDFIKSDEHVIKMLKGSSAAHLCVIVNSDNIRKVRKIAIYDGVEGNGIAKVANEIKYYRYITNNMPGLASMYPRILDFEIDKTFSSETIEYLDGENFYQTIKNGRLSYIEYKRSFIKFMNRLSKCASSSCRLASNPDADLDAYYVERSLSRLKPIEKIIPVKNEIIINGKEYVSPDIILRDILNNKMAREFLVPRTESFCIHGDLTLLNTVFTDKTKEIKLIDPRGCIGYWDLLYDYAKIEFTMAGFGEIILGDRQIVTTNSSGFEIHFNRIPQSCRELDDEFLDILSSDSIFMKHIVNLEPYWRERIAFAKATHFLADIPFRLFTDGTTETALASYIIGTYYLNEIYEVIKR
jgi:nucleoside-diphosphate-sugar epimerase